MTTLARRDDQELVDGLTKWCARQWPESGRTVVELDRPKAGWSNETLLVTTTSSNGSDDVPDRFVVRLPPPVPTWPTYDLRAQARVLDAVAVQGIRAPRAIALVDDDAWLGAPFLVMSMEPGRPGGEVPALDPWIAQSSVDDQRRLHAAFVEQFAAIHRLDWRGAGLAEVLRGGEAASADEIAAEIGWWADYIEWAADGDPTPSLASAIAWCANTAPTPAAPSSLCWGDARLGNVLFSDDRQVSSVLDWEMATIGPAEMDLGWYLVLDELMTHYVKQRVEGFPDRSEFIAEYERALGREVRDLEWYEIFALIRSIAINERQARLAAVADIPYPGVAGEQNPVLRFLARKIEAYGA